MPMGSPTDRVTLWGAIKEIGVFPVAFSTLVGGPSVLAMLQSVFKEWRLTPAFQWIVDGYLWITAQLASYVEPLILPAISWINSLFDWHIVLYPHWRPMFLLLLMFSLAWPRAYWIDGRRLEAGKILLQFVPVVQVTLAVSLVYGLLPGAGILFIGSLIGVACLGAVGLILGLREHRLHDDFMRLTGAPYMTDADREAAAVDGVLPPRTTTRIGIHQSLNLVGAFVTAVMIVGADVIVKRLGS